MKTYWKVVLSGFLTLMLFLALAASLQLLNQKSDVSVMLGYGLGSVQIFLYGWVLNLIWRKKEKHEEPKVN